MEDPAPFVAPLQKVPPLVERRRGLHSSTTPPSLKTSASDSAFEGRQRRTHPATRTFGPWSGQVLPTSPHCDKARKITRRTRSAPSLHLTCTARRVKTPPRSGEDTHKKTSPGQRFPPPGVLSNTPLFGAQHRSNFLMARPSQMCAHVLSLESDDQSSEVSSRVTKSQKHAPSQCKKKTRPHTMRTHTGTHTMTIDH